MIFPDNIGAYLSIDEVSLSQGELYTFVSNKDGKGRKKTIVASIKGTASKDIFDVLNLISLEERKKVKEVTLDMARNMESAVKMSFSMSELVTDRFHVVKLLLGALDQVRIKYRWEEIEKENTAIALAKEKGISYKSIELSNGDTYKQLLARGRHVLFKDQSKWTESQKKRGDLLFELFPDIKKAYDITMKFRKIYETKSKSDAKLFIENWIENIFIPFIFHNTANI